MLSSNKIKRRKVNYLIFSKIDDEIIDNKKL